MNVYKVARVMEKVWLVIAILSIIFAIYHTVKYGFQEGKMFILISIGICIYYGLKVKMRKSFEGRENEELEND